MTSQKQRHVNVWWSRQGSWKGLERLKLSFEDGHSVYIVNEGEDYTVTV